MFADLSTADLITLILSLLLALGFHEAMHAFASHWLGDTTASDLGRLSLNPIKHIDLFTTILLPVLLVKFGLPPFFAAKPVPFNPNRVKYEEFGVALIGIAGPLTNLALAVVAAGVFRLLGNDISIELFRTLLIFIQVNIGLFVFNMIPFPPLDGSRLLYAFAPEPLQNIMRSIEAAGFVSIMLFIVVLYQVPALGEAIGAINNTLLRVLVG